MRRLDASLLPGEYVTGILRLESWGPFEELWVMSQHHIARVAFSNERSRASVLVVAYEYMGAGLFEIGLRDGRTGHVEWVSLGTWSDPDDRDSVAERALEYLRLPHGSDGATYFQEPEPTRSHVWSRGAAVTL